MKVYFSFRSPYSWMSIHRLMQQVPGVFDRGEFIPYWNPDPATAAALAAHGVRLPYTEMSRAKHFYILRDTKRLARRLSLPMTWPVDIDPHWEVPHLAWLAARRHGLAEPCYGALTRARWERGENICDLDVVGKVAEEAGLDPDLARGAAGDPDVCSEAVSCLLTACDDDVFGIPYFRTGRQRFWGYDRVDDFVAALGHPAAADPLDQVPAAVRKAGAYDTDTAGGCG